MAEVNFDEFIEELKNIQNNINEKKNCTEGIREIENEINRPEEAKWSNLYYDVERIGGSTYYFQNEKLHDNGDGTFTCCHQDDDNYNYVRAYKDVEEYQKYLERIKADLENELLEIEDGISTGFSYTKTMFDKYMKDTEYDWEDEKVKAVEWLKRTFRT